MSETNNIPDALLRLPQVLKLIPVSRSGWRRGVKDGRYPQPVKVSERVRAWKASDIQKLIDDAMKCQFTK